MELRGAAMREEGMAPSVCADSLSGLVECAQFVPTHVSGFVAGPAYGDEEPCLKRAGLEDGESEFEVGDVAVVEGDFGKERGGVAKLENEVGVLLELFGVDDVGVLTAGGP